MFIEYVFVKNKMYWKRICHIIVTIIFIVFLIWYYLPENRLMRSVDVCGYYAGKTNHTCICIPSNKTGEVITTIFYPNFSFYKNIPHRKYIQPPPLPLNFTLPIK
jgi:hypothetical protein